MDLILANIDHLKGPRDRSDLNTRLPKGTVDINGKLSEDLSLFYTEDDMKNLFNWQVPLYTNVCSFLSQDFPGYTINDFKNRQSFLMELQAVLTSLKTFNLLTEDAHARKLLYNVC